MTTRDLRDNLETLLSADPDCGNREDLSEMVATSSRLRGWLDSFDLRCARRARQLADNGQAEPAELLLTREGNLSGKDSKNITDRERVGDTMNDFEQALGNGQVSSGHLDAIAAATRNLDDEVRAEFTKHEAELLAKAATMAVDTFTRECRKLARQLIADAAGDSDADELDNQRKLSCVKRWVDKVTGMHHTHLELDPISDAKLWSVIDSQLARLRQNNGDAKTPTPWQQLQVDAVIASVEAGLNAGADGGDPGRRVPEVTVLIDWQTLTSGLHNNGICETEDGIALPVSTVRRMCCDAEVLPVVLGGDGVPLDAGRTRRTATPQQRAALRAMYSTCVGDNCTVPFSKCRIHHIEWWWKHFGPTDLENLVPLCDRDHHLVHEGGWQIVMTPDRTITWHRPDGTTNYTGNSINRLNPTNPAPESKAAA